MRFWLADASSALMAAMVSVLTVLSQSVPPDDPVDEYDVEGATITPLDAVLNADSIPDFMFCLAA